MAKSKQEFAALRKKKLGDLESAVRNALISLHKMGIQSADIDIDEAGTTAYILFTIDDVVRLIQSKTKASVRKVAGDSVEVVCYTEDNTVVVRVRK